MHKSHQCRDFANLLVYISFSFQIETSLNQLFLMTLSLNIWKGNRWKIIQKLTWKYFCLQNLLIEVGHTLYVWTGYWTLLLGIIWLSSIKGMVSITCLWVNSIQSSRASNNVRFCLTTIIANPSFLQISISAVKSAALWPN